MTITLSYIDAKDTLNGHNDLDKKRNGDAHIPIRINIGKIFYLPHVIPVSPRFLW